MVNLPPPLQLLYTTPGVSEQDHRPSATGNMDNHEPTVNEVEEEQNQSTDF